MTAVCGTSMPSDCLILASSWWMRGWGFAGASGWPLSRWLELDFRCPIWQQGSSSVLRQRHGGQHSHRTICIACLLLPFAGNGKERTTAFTHSGQPATVGYQRRQQVFYGGKEGNQHFGIGGAQILISPRAFYLTTCNWQCQGSSSLGPSVCQSMPCPCPCPLSPQSQSNHLLSHHETRSPNPGAGPVHQQQSQHKVPALHPYQLAAAKQVAW